MVLDSFEVREGVGRFICCHPVHSSTQTNLLCFPILMPNRVSTTIPGMCVMSKTELRSSRDRHSSTEPLFTVWSHLRKWMLCAAPQIYIHLSLQGPDAVAIGWELRFIPRSDKRLIANIESPALHVVSLVENAKKKYKLHRERPECRGMQ